MRNHCLAVISGKATDQKGDAKETARSSGEWYLVTFQVFWEQTQLYIIFLFLNRMKGFVHFFMYIFQYVI